MAQKNRLVLQSGQVEQYNPAWISAQPFLEKIRLGQPVLIEATRTSGYTFRSIDIGAVLDLMIHDLELIVSLLTQSIEEISAIGFAPFGGFEDSAFAQLNFSNGSIVRLTASRVEQQAVRFMKIVDSSQTVLIDFQNRIARRIQTSELILKGDFSPSHLDSTFVIPPVNDFMKEMFPTEELAHEPFDALSLEMENFIAAILDGSPSRVPAERVVKAIEIAEIIQYKINRKLMKN